MRKPILAGNWKMFKTVAEATALVSEMRAPLLSIGGVDRVLCPPFTALAAVSHLVQGTALGVGAQDMHWEESGAYTGEVSPAMVAEFCQYVIVGHSERRELFGETDATVNRKIVAALAHGLTPIVCVGESLALRQEGKTEIWVTNQVIAALQGFSAAQVSGIVLAYEPIWAIGTGLSATAEEAERVCGAVVRATITQLYDQSTADAVRIQYGGSVKPGNTSDLMAKPNIDGALIGGASLKAADYCGIVRLAAQAKGLL